MRSEWQIRLASEQALRVVAELLATKLRQGDLVMLNGDLGAGKTTFARYVIRALLADDMAEVPSPTFTLVQTYATGRFEVRHADLYRLSGPDELDELGLLEEVAMSDAVTLVEWPDRAGDAFGSDRYELHLNDRPGGDPEERDLHVIGHGAAAARLDRLAAAYALLAAHFAPDDFAALRIAYLQGDASTRSYARVDSPTGPVLLMDMPRQPDGPPVRDGRSYSQLAHLAEDARPFVAIAQQLAGYGLSVPAILAYDAQSSMALIEDLGTGVFAAVLARGVPQRDLWRAAVDVLVELRRHTPPEVVGGGVSHRLPDYDAGVLGEEVRLFAQWYWPFAFGQTMPLAIEREFETAWEALVPRVADVRDSWVLRDVHSPNLLWLPDRHGVRRVGLIDFQDAQRGHAAYDLASLLQDARLDVPRELHDELLAYYCSAASAAEAGFDEVAFRAGYALLAAQRATKILGIFARLAKRDGKPGYLRHIPRIWSYLGWNLAHPELTRLRDWFDRYIPPKMRPDLENSGA